MNIQYARQYRRLVSHNTNASTAQTGKPNHNILGKILVHFHKTTGIDQLVFLGQQVQGLVGAEAHWAPSGRKKASMWP